MATLLVSVSTGAMGSIVKKLGTLLSDKYKLLKNARDDIKILKDELEAMYAFLIVMAKVEKPDEQTKLRVHAVRELSYEIDNSIDKFMIRVEGELTSKSDNKNTEKVKCIKIRRKISKYIKDIKRQVKEISERHGRYTSDESSRIRNENVDPRICAIYKEVSELVGINGPRDELVEWLSNREGELGHQPKVLSIVGCGGLGKTTLAKQVFDKLEANYKYRAFVSISRSPNMSKILSSILCQLRKKHDAHAGEDPHIIVHQIRDDAHAGEDPHIIVDQIRDFLKDKRYFIVIDDIWDIQAWQTLNSALIRNGHDSVIMTTTRMHDVANSCCSSQRDLVFKIQPLDVSDSKRLFFKRIFGSEDKCPSNLKETAEDILNKCGGLPLAISAISSLLATRKTKEEWDRVRSSGGFAKGNNSEIDAMDYILSLSYFDLPRHLKSCLLYLTMFPEDFEIEREQLVRLWIYEGFMHDEDEKYFFESGETYFSELVNRSLVQPVNIGADGKAKHCRVHDTILDFLVDKATKENFCTSLRNCSKPGNRVHRLLLTGNEDEEIVEQLDLSHARSLICFSEGDLLPSLAKSKVLRVLDLSYCSGLRNHHLEDTRRLLLLRYLTVSGDDINMLPRQIGDLVYLELLNARATKLVELPKSVTRLQRLACLFVPDETKFPDRIGNMKMLQDLGNINPMKQSLNFVEELGKLENLKKLFITWDTRGSSRETSLKEQLFFSSLRKLETCNLATTKIEFDLTEGDAALTRHSFFPLLISIQYICITTGKVRWISKWLALLANLETLSICRGAEIEQEDINMVGSIPTLLKFHCGLCPEPIIFNTEGFQLLREFDLEISNEFMFEVGAMPNLKKLILGVHLCEFKSAHGGRIAGAINFGIHHLSSLAQLRITLYCIDVSSADVEAAHNALKSMADALPNHPTLEMRRLGMHMLQDDEDSDDEDSGDDDLDDEDSGDEGSDDEDSMLQSDEDLDGMLQDNRAISFPEQAERKRKRGQKP